MYTKKYYSIKTTNLPCGAVWVSLNSMIQSKMTITVIIQPKKVKFKSGEEWRLLLLGSGMRGHKFIK